MHLIIGLGNPGLKYDHTRHNVGFDVLTLLAESLSISMGRNRCGALVGEGMLDGRKLVLAKPQTYMNLSGEAVSRLMHWYKVSPLKLLVIYDDIDLSPGVLRIRPNGSAGTHNGMRSIIEELGTQAFPRIRVGIGKPVPGYDLADWVLSHYQTPEQRQIAFDAYRTAADAAELFVREGVESAMQRFNPQKLPRSPKSKPEGEAAAQTEANKPATVTPLENENER